MNAYTTYTKSTNAHSEQVPMHTEVEGPACLWITLSDALKSNWIHHSSTFPHIYFWFHLYKNQGPEIESLPPYSSTLLIKWCTYDRKGMGSKILLILNWGLLWLSNFSLCPIALPFLTWVSEVFSLEIHIFYPPSFLYAKSAWPQSIVLPEACYTVGGQQQPQNILHKLNETWRK